MVTERERRDGNKKSPPRSGTGREELRSTWFRPYLLRLRAERGEAAVRALLSTAGIPIGLMNDDAGWLSVNAGKRLLRAIDIRTSKVVWEVPQTGNVNSWGGVLSTAGRVVFFGDDSGALGVAALVVPSAAQQDGAVRKTNNQAPAAKVGPAVVGTVDMDAVFKEYEIVVFGGVMMLTMIFMPKGLVPTLAGLLRRRA